MKFGGMMLLLIGIAGFASASGDAVAPEISPASATGALVLLSGALLVIRGRHSK
jgi:hypothetical protein